MIAMESDVSPIQRLDGTGIHLGLLGAFFRGEMRAESTAKGDGVLILLTAGDDVAFVDGATEEVVEGADVALVGGGVEADDGRGGGAAVGVAAVLGSLARRIVIVHNHTTPAALLVVEAALARRSVGGDNRLVGQNVGNDGVVRHGHESVGRRQRLEDFEGHGCCGSRGLFQEFEVAVW